MFNSKQRETADAAPSRLVIASNRAPVTVSRRRRSFVFKESIGGLATGLRAYLEKVESSPTTEQKHVWVGWPGLTVSGSEKEELSAKLVEEFSVYPVFLDEQELDCYYNGFCNSTIWPLFHYFPSYAVYEKGYWESYVRVNERFAERLVETLRPGDTLWIQDYHLLLVPRMVREKLGGTPIGFFLHIPFPSFEIFRLLPSSWRAEILEGMLGADLIGFHTHDYTRYFLRCVLNVLGYEHSLGEVSIEGRISKADTFPMGIDYVKYSEASAGPGVVKARQELARNIKGARVIISIDRLDYTKGVANKLRAYAAFLDKSPEWHGRVVLAMVAAPSRTSISLYRGIRREINELVGEINGRFGNINWVPIFYQNRAVPFNSLIALYGLGDIALVTPLRDGMNLIAKEYVAARTDGTGVLILSEMTGAVKELGEALIVNPNDIGEIREAIEKALVMENNEQEKRIRTMQTRLQQYNIADWAGDFLESLHSLKEKQKSIAAKIMGEKVKRDLEDHFRTATERLLLLDYDGTLVPFAETPELATPPVELITILEELAGIPGTEVALVSGRDRTTLDSWFGDLDIALIAEHGAWIKTRGGDWEIIEPMTSDWIPQVTRILQRYVNRLPGSFVERKSFSVAWHYRNADVELAQVKAKKLVDDLVNFAANNKVQILHGNKVIEVNGEKVDKGKAALRLLSRRNYNFVMAVGDDRTDEDLFVAMPDSAYTIRVGVQPSHARLNLKEQKDVIRLLRSLISNSSGRNQ
ncbi:MAG: bifunctional alpha,alpha-trehalose-phosphate synthase (UDP-forming)/trehalose-phosphatase [Actinomycetota bacterium]|nr:bifunctional alpha,alpha-trehalose-phosphate synthase (UDP-forming)/trehalose-phosphatase [Actinomycetota bacterium]